MVGLAANRLVRRGQYTFTNRISPAYAGAHFSAPHEATFSQLTKDHESRRMGKQARYLFSP